MSIKNEHKMLETPYTRDRVKGVLPAFVMRVRLISRPHYVRLRIIAMHCDFSSESYIHIDPIIFLLGMPFDRLVRRRTSLRSHAICSILVYRT